MFKQTQTIRWQRPGHQALKGELPIKLPTVPPFLRKPLFWMYLQGIAHEGEDRVIIPLDRED